MEIKNISLAPSAIEILESLRLAIKADPTDLNFEHYHAVPDNKEVLVIGWNDQETDQAIVIRAFIEYRTISNYENCCEDIDIDSINIFNLLIDNESYHLTKAVIPSELNEHTLKPLLTSFFEAGYENLKFKESGYSVNLLSETPSKRGHNWINVTQPVQA